MSREQSFILEEYSTCWKRIAKDLGLEAILFYNVFFSKSIHRAFTSRIEEGMGFNIECCKSPDLEKLHLYIGKRTAWRKKRLEGSLRWWSGKGGERKIEIGATEC